jgi:ribosomal protein L11 methyltransferase
MRFGRRLWVTPFHEPVTADDAVVVQLDPGLAFGTGTHPSTAMCLQWLDALAPLRGRAIDYGCGSGILAIAAARLGADSVQAFDIDPQALLATRENAARNAVGGLVNAIERADALIPAADILLANILAGTLVQLAAELRALVRVGGQFVLAGILKEQQEMVVDAFAAWADMDRRYESGDWIALAGIRIK